MRDFSFSILPRTIFLGLLLALTLLNSCKKKEEPAPPVQAFPSVSTLSINDITDSKAKGGGNVGSEGTSAITAVGICWDTLAAPTTLRAHTKVGAGTGTFLSTMTGLIEGKTYFVRAYATNASGTSYGEELSFRTLVSNTTRLTAKIFKLAAYTVNPPYMSITDYYAVMEPCKKDDLLLFQKAGIVYFDEGGTKCNPGAPQENSGTWAWTDNEKSLIVTLYNSPLTYNVVLNDGITLKWSWTFEEQGTTYTATQTYQKQ